MVRFETKPKHEDLSSDSARVARVKKYSHLLGMIALDVRKDALKPLKHYKLEYKFRCLAPEPLNKIISIWEEKGFSAITSTDVVKAAEQMADSYDASGRRFVK